MPLAPEARTRLVNLFSFFKAVEERRTTLVRNVEDHSWKLRWTELPKHPSLRIQTPADGNEFSLTLTRPDIHACPAPPDSIRNWLVAGWEQPEKNAEYPDKKAEINASGSPLETRFDQLPERMDGWREWNCSRDQWVEVERPARAALRIWERLFALHSQLMRDGEAFELVLGDGVFDWNGSHHPILLRTVELSFRPEIREFAIQDADGTPQFYSSLFADFPNLPVKQWQQQVIDGELHPLEGEGVTDWLKAVIGSFQDGQLVQDEPKGIASHQRIGRAPILFLRKRETGRLSFLDEILADLLNVDKVSDSLLRIVGCAPPPSELADSEENAYANEALDALLTKQANAEQLSILRRLANRHGVLVQGPPGTGKTHTVANLIGSLLAEGKTVLVTSHTTKALKVLRDHVVGPLRSLCVSVLDSDMTGKKELESAVKSLAARLDDDPARLQQEAKVLADHRQQLINKLHASRTSLEKAVNGEYRSLIIDGQECEPVQAAKEVFEGTGIHDWIPGELMPASPLPLSIAETQALYASNAKIPVNDEPELALALPLLTELWTPDNFERLIKELSALDASTLNFRRDLWTNTAAQGDLDRALDRMREGVDILARSEQEPWRLAAIEAGIEAGAARILWEMACDDIAAIERQVETAAEHLYNYSPQTPDGGDQKSHLVVVEQIINFLAGGNRLKFVTLLWRPEWKRFIESSRVEGSVKPNRLEHFHALQTKLHLLIAQETLIIRWQQHLEPHGLPSLITAPAPVKFAAQYVTSIKTCLDWHADHWRPIEAILLTQGLDWPRLLDEAPPSTSAHPRAERLRHSVSKVLPQVIAAERSRRRQAKLLSALTAYQQSLRKFATVKAVDLLAEAVKIRSATAYRRHHGRIEYLLGLQPAYRDRQGKLGKIRVAAPNWAEAIQNRRSPHEQEMSPGDPIKAWRWRQLSEELDRRAALSVPALQDKIERLGTELMGVTIDLVERMAWAKLIVRIKNDDLARQALLGWVTANNRAQGAGRNVDMYKREANKLMGMARGAVPVWIMPFSRVTENFHPIRDHFDVLIVDEASQEDVVGLAPFYMADKVIVVGDDEQVTPLDVGGAQQPIQDLIDQWLNGLPNDRFFDLKTSIYDRAKYAFGSSIRLKEHFRCVPEIIQFSNHLSYGGDIKPLRESASTPVKPALVAHRVDGIRIDGKKENEEEAEAITALIAAAIEQTEYAGKTIGVISLLGSEQADRIERLLRNRIDAVEYEKRRILCGNPAQFQGDERDVIFLSVVDSKAEGDGPLGMKGDGADGLWKKRYNVAASRAKDQLWVVYSLDHQTQLKPGDLRRRLIEHAIDPVVLMRLLEEGEECTESPFEADVYKRLVAEGYQVTPQWSVGAYRIDLVVEGTGGRRLAIECDGHRWHYDKVAEDLSRQALLERLGWCFVRIGGIAFYRDKSRTMQPVFEKLRLLDITPVVAQPVITPPEITAATDTLLDRVKRRAAEMSQQWKSATALESTTVVDIQPIGVIGYAPSLVEKRTKKPRPVADDGRFGDEKQPALDPEFAGEISLAPKVSVPQNPGDKSIASKLISSDYMVSHEKYLEFIQLVKQTGCEDKYRNGISFTCGKCSSFMIPSFLIYDLILTIEKDHYEIDLSSLKDRLAVSIDSYDEWDYSLPKLTSSIELDEAVFDSENITDSDGECCKLIYDECAFVFDSICDCSNVIKKLGRMVFVVGVGYVGEIKGRP